jgi:hypothetical protein
MLGTFDDMFLVLVGHPYPRINRAGHIFLGARRRSGYGYPLFNFPSFQYFVPWMVA